jgi:hypothetical protein
LHIILGLGANCLLGNSGGIVNPTASFLSGSTSDFETILLRNLFGMVDDFFSEIPFNLANNFFLNMLGTACITALAGTNGPSALPRSFLPLR